LRFDSYKKVKADKTRRKKRGVEKRDRKGLKKNEEVEETESNICVFSRYICVCVKKKEK